MDILTTTAWHLLLLVTDSIVSNERCAQSPAHPTSHVCCSVLTAISFFARGDTPEKFKAVNNATPVARRRKRQGTVGQFW